MRVVAQAVDADADADAIVGASAVAESAVGDGVVILIKDSRYSNILRFA
jgi:hypothetical protein